jgi:hypothetical protein
MPATGEVEWPAFARQPIHECFGGKTAHGPVLNETANVLLVESKPDANFRRPSTVRDFANAQPALILIIAHSCLA